MDISVARISSSGGRVKSVVLGGSECRLILVIFVSCAGLYCDFSPHNPAMDPDAPKLDIWCP